MDANTIGILVAACINAWTAWMVWKMKREVVATKVAAEQTEKNTNSMKDALVMAEKIVSRREGIDEGLATAAKARGGVTQ